MRFSVTYEIENAKTKSAKRKSIELLNSFLNFHLIEKFHGWSYECLFVKLIDNAPPKKKWKLKRTYDRWGNIELPISFKGATEVEEFKYAFVQIKNAVNLVATLSIQGNRDFKQEALISDLAKLEKKLPKSIEQYKALHKQQGKMDSQVQLRRVDGYINACKQHPLPHTKHLKGARIYDHFDTDELMPYRYIYAEIFSTLLRNANISTPGYKEIYFSIDETLEKAKTDLAAFDWFKYTYCAIDIKKYRRASAKLKEKMLLDSLVSGLRLIAFFDHLDKTKIESVIRIISQGKTNTPLTYAVSENNTHIIQIHYEIGPDHTQSPPFYITITNKATKAEVTQLIGHFDTWWVPHSLKKIKIGKNEVSITGGGGMRGEITRSAENRPDSYKFSLP